MEGIFIKLLNLSIQASILITVVLLLRLGQFTRNYTQTTKRGLLTTNKG